MVRAFALARDPAKALHMVEEALALFRRVGDAAGIAITASTVAEIAVDAGDLDDAERLINESLEGAREGVFGRPSRTASSTDPSSRCCETTSKAPTRTYRPRSARARPTTTPRPREKRCRRQRRSRRADETPRARRCCGPPQTVLAVAPSSAGPSLACARGGNRKRAPAGDQASWDAATVAGAELTLATSEKLVLADELGGPSGRREGAPLGPPGDTPCRRRPPALRRF